MNINPVSRMSLKLFFVLFVAASFTIQANAQMPAPGLEIDILKNDVGEWNCEIKTWATPNAEPAVSKGTESTRMFGGYWTITNFEGNMMGMDFKGHGSYGYDTKKKKYVGTWIDTLGPYMMHTEGSFDKETETLTLTGDSPGPDGVTMFTYTFSNCYKDGRVMIMHMQPKGSGDDQKMKLMQISYTKKESK